MKNHIFPSLNIILALAAVCALGAILAPSTQLFAQGGPPAAPGGGAAGGFGGFGGGRGSVGTPGYGAPPIDLYEAGVAGSRGRGNLYLFNDLEWTAISRMEETIEPQIVAVERAREALLRATLTAPASQADLDAKARTLGEAELTLALARADAFPALVAQLKLNPARIRSLATVMNR